MPYILREYQEIAVKKGIEFLLGNSKKNSVIVAPTGCHAKGTKILLLGGSTKNVEDIIINDKLLSPDGQIRTVKKLHSGAQQMYRILPNKGEPFVVNENHILSLVSTNEGKGKKWNYQTGNEITNISLVDYLRKSKSWKHLRKLYHSKEMPFHNKINLKIPPYIMGLLLGDGCLKNNSISLCSADAEIIDEFKSFAFSQNMDIREKLKPNNKAISLHLIKRDNKRNRMFKNKITTILQEYGLMNCDSSNKYIPCDYKISLIKDRYEILAGLLDTDGSHDGMGGYDFISKSIRLANDVVFIARSLGITAIIRKVKKHCQNDFAGYYFRVNLSGYTHNIPCRIKRKIPPKRRQKKNPLVTGFKIEKINIDNYYGFELDGDHLYLTGDFMVHHNSGKSLIIANIAKSLHGNTIVFQPSKELLEQNYDKYISYGEEAEIYSASMNQKTIGKVTFATIGSVVNKPDLFKQFKFCVVDECHLVSPDSNSMYKRFFSNLELKVLGLTATPIRMKRYNYPVAHSKLCMLDRMRPKFFQEYLDIIQIQDLVKLGYFADIEYFQYDFDASQLTLNSTGGDYTERSIDIALTANSTLEKISFLFTEIENKTKHILIFVESVSTAHKLQTMLGEQNCGLVKATMNKKEREIVLRQFKSGEIKAVVNVGILTTGFDFPELDCIIMARPTMSLGLYYQIIGRCVRPHTNKEKAQVFDFVGNFEKFGKITDLVIEKKNGLYVIHNGKNILTNVGLSEINTEETDVVREPVMNFGKYNGTKLSEVPKEYLLWVRDNVEKKKYNTYIFKYIEKLS
jgi:hypothetical protein